MADTNLPITLAKFLVGFGNRQKSTARARKKDEAASRGEADTRSKKYCLAVSYYVVDLGREREREGEPQETIAP